MMDASLVATCGINCALCLGYQRKKNHCPGCRHIVSEAPVSIMRCIIKNCEKRLNNGWENCAPCDKPCARLKQLDKRYRAKYMTSPVDNLNEIKNKGIKSFLFTQLEKWECECGSVVCIHKGCCLSCGRPAAQ